MSGSEAPDGAERQALARVEGAVTRLLETVDGLRARTTRAEARVAEVETLLRRFTRGDADPASLERRVRELGEENAELRRRLEEGREGVDRLLARIRFIEEQSP